MCNCENSRKLRKLKKKIRKLQNTVEEGFEAIHDLIISQGETIMVDLTRITNEVAENASVIQSAITLLNGLSEQIRELSTDPVALGELADQLDAQSEALAAAVAANTPAEEPEEPTEPTPEEPAPEEPAPEE